MSKKQEWYKKWEENCDRLFLNKEGFVVDTVDFFYSLHLKDIEKIREMIKAKEPLLEKDKYDGGYDCCGCSTLRTLLEDIMNDPLLAITDESHENT